MKYKAILISDNDNVATAVRAIIQGEPVEFSTNREPVIALNHIPKGHKLAISDIGRGEHIYKYGETIGITKRPIKKGEHVHIHNIDSERGRGDKK
jgi:altronate dehydratase small subunit